MAKISWRRVFQLGITQRSPTPTTLNPMAAIIPYGVAASAAGAQALIAKYARQHVKKAGKAVVKRIQQDAKRPKSLTSLERAMGVPRASPAATSSRPAKRARTVPTIMQSAQGGYQQHTTAYVKSGRKVKVASVADQLQRRNIGTAVMQFKSIPQFSGDFGVRAINNRVIASTGKRNVPIYLMDLTHLANAGQPCFHRLYMWTSGAADGKCGWDSVSGENSVGGTTLVPFLRYASQNFPAASFPDRLHFGRTDIKLNLYGMKTRPTEFILSLVRFKDDHYTPVDDQGLNVIGTCDEIGTAFWQSRIKRLTANPIADQYTIRDRAMQVINRKVYKIGPTTTDQSDPDPHCITVNWKHDINRIVSMRKYQTVSTDDVEVVDANKVPIDTNTSQPSANYTPFAKDRVYLLIEAKAWVPQVETDPTDATNSPSFDYNVKTTVRCDV